MRFQLLYHNLVKIIKNSKNLIRLAANIILLQMIYSKGIITSGLAGMYFMDA